MLFFPISHLGKKEGKKTGTMNYVESFSLVAQNEILVLFWAQGRVGKLNRQATLGLELSILDAIGHV